MKIIDNEVIRNPVVSPRWESLSRNVVKGKLSSIGLIDD